MSGLHLRRRALLVPGSAAGEPSVAFPDGTVINVRNAGAGTVTIVEADGVTVTTPSTYDLAGQWAEVSLHKVGADLWDLTGAVVEAP